MQHSGGPLTSLLKGAPQQLHWTEEANKAFHELKERFTNTPVLAHPDPRLPFIVEVDASEVGVGTVLAQRTGSSPNLHPFTFLSRKLSPRERNYAVGDCELLAVKKDLKTWHWLEGAQQPLLIWMDHQNLEYIRAAKRLNLRQAR